MITKLTPEQEAKIPEYLNKFLLVGRRTKPVSFEEIKQSVRYLYENILQIKTPKIILVDSPYQLCSQLESQLENQLGNQLWNQLWNQLGSQLWNQLRNQLWNQIERQLRNQLENQLENQLRNQLGSQLRNQLRNQIERQLFGISNLYFHEYYYLSFIFNEVLESKLTPKLNNFVNAISKIHAAHFTKDLAIVSQFPISLHLDKDGKLHNENGKAIEYKDGSGLYACNGNVEDSLFQALLN